MKTLLLLLVFVAFNVTAEPDLPDGYDFLMKISRPLEKVKDKQVYTVVLIKPLSEGDDGKAFSVALSLLDLQKGQYVAIKNVRAAFVATEEKVILKPGTKDEVQSQTLMIGFGETIAEAVAGFETQTRGVGMNNSYHATGNIRTQVTEMLGGDAMCVEGK